MTLNHLEMNENQELHHRGMDIPATKRIHDKFNEKTPNNKQTKNSRQQQQQQQNGVQ